MAHSGYAIPILDADLDLAHKVFDTNLFGRVAVTQALSPFLIAAKGTLVNIGSISGINPTPWSAMYNACCAAVHMWSDTLRLELDPFGVKVVLVR
jgi:1-acylglycerone phosphate reductase